MKTYNVNDEINVILFGDIYDAVITRNDLHNGDYFEVKIGNGHEIIGRDDIVGKCSAVVVFEREGKMKRIETCSPKEAWKYVEEVVVPHGWKLKGVKKGFEY